MNHHMISQLSALRIEDMQREAAKRQLGRQVLRQRRTVRPGPAGPLDRVMLQLWNRLTGILERRGVLLSIPGPLDPRGPLSS